MFRSNSPQIPKLFSCIRKTVARPSSFDLNILKWYTNCTLKSSSRSTWLPHAAKGRCQRRNAGRGPEQPASPGLLLGTPETAHSLCCNSIRSHSLGRLGGRDALAADLSVRGKNPGSVPGDSDRVSPSHSDQCRARAHPGYRATDHDARKPDCDHRQIQAVS